MDFDSEGSEFCATKNIFLIQALVLAVRKGKPVIAGFLTAGGIKLAARSAIFAGSVEISSAPPIRAG